MTFFTNSIIKKRKRDDKVIEKIFKLKENNTTVKTEILGGITTFLTMAYILAVNPNILSASGMDANAVLIATALASAVGCYAMAFLANYPFALAPGLGINAYFAYTVCLKIGYSWQFALFAVFVEGVIFIILSLVNVREAIFNAIPNDLKQGISAGIGFFIVFIGLQNAGLIVANDATVIGLTDFRINFHTTGIASILSLIGLIIIVVLQHHNIRGSMLIGIFSVWLLGILCQLTGIYQVDPSLGAYSLIPSFSSFNITDISKTFGQCFLLDFSSVKISDFIVIIFVFLFSDLFDTIGTLIGVSNSAGMVDKEGRMPRIKQALLADAIATCAGAVFGTSTTTTFVESSSGISEGARTGLATFVTGTLFLISLVFAPIFVAIPGFATAPALIFVGYVIMHSFTKINYKDLPEAFPAGFCAVTIALTYSISDGMAAGIVSYVIINLCCGKGKKISVLMYALAAAFLLKYIFL